MKRRNCSWDKKSVLVALHGTVNSLHFISLTRISITTITPSSVCCIAISWNNSILSNRIAERKEREGTWQNERMIWRKTKQKKEKETKQKTGSPTTQPGNDEIECRKSWRRPWLCRTNETLRNTSIGGDTVSRYKIQCALAADGSPRLFGLDEPVSASAFPVPTTLIGLTCHLSWWSVPTRSSIPHRLYSRRSEFPIVFRMLWFVRSFFKFEQMLWGIE